MWNITMDFTQPGSKYFHYDTEFSINETIRLGREKKENITSRSEPITRKYYLRANKEARCSSSAHSANWSRMHNG